MEEYIYGYPVKYLALFARACLVCGIKDKDLYDFAKNTESAYTFVKTEYDRLLKETLDNMAPHEATVIWKD